jgi:hypothetical protein
MNILYLFSISIIVSGSLYLVFALGTPQVCDTSSQPRRGPLPSSHIYITDANGNKPYIPLTYHTAILHDDDVWNTSTQPRIVQVTLTIQNQDTGQQVFNQTQSLQMKACSGPESVKWRFVPVQIANYIAKVSDDRSNVHMIFQSMLDATKSQTVSSPLEQLRSGMDSHSIVCKQDLQLVIKSEDDSPACVKFGTATTLIKHGWASSAFGISSDGARTYIINDTQASKVNATLPASFLPCDIPYLESNTGVTILYMPTNSVGKICVRYSNHNDSPEPFYGGINIFDPNNSYQSVPYIATWNDLGNTTVIQKNDSFTVVNWIKTGNHTGLYGLNLYCGGIPFAVGYNSDSNLTSSDFPFVGKAFSCPAIPYESKIVSMTGINIKHIPYP